MLVEKDDVLRRAMACRAFAAPEAPAVDGPVALDTDGDDGEGDAGQA